jgi:outer membrane protein assembly factor BamB
MHKPAEWCVTFTAIFVFALSSGLHAQEPKKPKRIGTTARKKQSKAQEKESGAAALQNWPSFRGPNAAGVADGDALPTEWDVSAKDNLKWMTEIPGLGLSSPVIWGKRLFVTTAIGGSSDLKVGLYGDIEPVKDDSVHSFWLYCLDKKTGKVLWKEKSYEGVPKVKRHTKASHANCTAATDGKHVVAFYGSEGLYCYDMAGKLIWKKDLGLLDAGFYMVPKAQWGFGSSPIIHEGLVIVQCDVQKGSFLAAFDVKTGDEKWKQERDEVPTWGSPTIVESGKKKQVVVNGYKHIGGYSLDDGKQLWRLKGGGDIPVPTPVVGHGLIFITNAHGQLAPIYAIKPMAKGDVSLNGNDTSNSGVAWAKLREGGYMQTPLVYGDHLYVCRDNGVLSCYDAKTGEQRYKQPPPSPATARSTLRAKKATSMSSRPVRHSSYWRRIRWARSAWPLPRSPRGRSSSAAKST